MSLKLLMRQSRKISTCMIKTMVRKISRSLGEIRRRNDKIKGRMDLNLLSLEIVLTHISKVNDLRVDPRWQNLWGQRKGKPIKCWGCEGDHLYRYCPHKEEKMRNMHNIQEENIVEYVARNIPRIYATLEN
jgi:hypothetical protein